MSINFFVPCGQEISSITNANPGVVTTTLPHGYLAGIIVRLVIPPECGMQQLAGNQVLATIIDSTSFSIGIDTRDFDPFHASGNQSPTVIPMGEEAFTLENSVKNNNNIPPEYGWRTP